MTSARGGDLANVASGPVLAMSTVSNTPSPARQACINRSPTTRPRANSTSSLAPSTHHLVITAQHAIRAVAGCLVFGGCSGFGVGCSGLVHCGGVVCFGCMIRFLCRRRLRLVVGISSRARLASFIVPGSGSASACSLALIATT